MAGAPAVRHPEARNSKVPSSRRPDIQGLRAIAVIMVVVFHAGLPVPGGFVGVDVFFVISGFVITGMLHREWLDNGRIRFANFYLRRFKRLTPALALMVSSTVLIGFFVLSPFGQQQNVAATAIGALFMCANFVITIATGGYFDAPAETNPLLNTWSLSVEEQFYLAFPAILVLGWWLARRHGWMRHSPVFIVGCVAAISFILAICAPLGLSVRFGTILLGFYGPLSRAWEFAAGALLALLISKRSVIAPRWFAIAGWLGLVGLGCSLVVISETTPFPGTWTLVPVFSTVLLLMAGSHSSLFTTRVLSSRPLTYLGDRSYSIYLWHWPFIVFALLLWPNTWWVGPAAVVVSLIPALASYKWVENPLRAASQFSRGASVRLMVMVITPALGVTGLFGLLIPWYLVSHSTSQNATHLSSPHLGERNGCKTDDPTTIRDPRECIITQGSQSPIYLVGDSNADQFTEGLSIAAKRRNHPLSIFAFGGCPLADIEFLDAKSGKPWRTGCGQFKAAAMQWLDTAKPGLVFISSADFYMRDASISAMSNGPEAAMSQAEKLNLYVAGLTRTIEQLKGAGHKVVLIETIPNFRLETEVQSERSWLAVNRCSSFLLWRNGCLRVGGESFASVAKRQGEIWAGTTALATSVGVGKLDFREQLCPSGQCLVQRGEVAIYRDPGHITVDQSEALADAFERAIVDSER